ncbi:MAG: PrsW family intramembrane metalloprotease [Euryarchaeota archaeon]|nr:PrsW family intramembrane metalloprotease [Euryarchaeota archaeon]
MADATLTELIVLAIFAFTPPLIFMGIVRRTERYGQEPWHRVLRTFMWGAVFAVLIAVVLSVFLILFVGEVDRIYVLSGRFSNFQLIVLAIIVAPITEEFAKGVGVYLARPIIDEPEDGLVYGAASGLGFAATENLLYGLAALIAPEGGIGVSLLVIGVRSISSALLHASASGTFGLGIARSYLWPGQHRALPYYVGAVVLHATFNTVASLSTLYPNLLGEGTILLGAIGLALLAFAIVRFAIVREDRRRVSW